MLQKVSSTHMLLHWKPIFEIIRPTSIKEAQSEIETITGVKRSETQVAEFLKKNSISVAEK